MKTEWLHYNENKWLIVFCNGWGMDSTPFRPLLSENYDVLVCYDYSEDAKDHDIRKLAEIYERIHLIGWSMGVAYAQKYFADVADCFDKTIAVNGTLYPIDEMLGIPEDICKATLHALNEETQLKFYRRMCRSSSAFETFMANKPQRTVNDQKDELAAIIADLETTHPQHSLFKDVIIGLKDLVIPAENQLRFWKKGNVKKLQCGHFPFYLWKSWDELLEYAC